MGFASGSVSFRRFAVVGDQPSLPDQVLLDKLSENALRPGEIGVPEEVEYGWNGGRHILDGSFGFENNVYNDCLVFALRVDTNKVPSDLKKAWQMIEEESIAKDNPSGFLSKNQKREAKETLKAKIDDELRTGKFRKSRLIPVLWDLPAQTIYSSCPVSQFDKLSELFSRTFGLDLQPLSSGSIALRLLEPKGHRRDYEDLRPTRFVLGPEGESQHPEYPWVAKGPEPKDFLGNEFLAWLWYEAEKHEGVIKTESGEVTIFFDKALDLDCTYGQTGKDSIRGDGVARMPESRDALRVGKLPRKAGLIFNGAGNEFSFSLGAESLSLMTLKLPEVKDADTPRTLFEERIGMVRDLCKAFDGMYAAFLKLRTGSGWEGQTNNMKKWMLIGSTRSGSPVSSVVMGEIKVAVGT